MKAGKKGKRIYGTVIAKIVSIFGDSKAAGRQKRCVRKDRGKESKAAGRQKRCVRKDRGKERFL